MLSFEEKTKQNKCVQEKIIILVKTSVKWALSFFYTVQNTKHSKGYTNFDPGQMQMIEESIMHIYWAAAYETFQNHRLPESITAVVEEQSEPY